MTQLVIKNVCQYWHAIHYATSNASLHLQYLISDQLLTDMINVSN